MNGGLPWMFISLVPGMLFMVTGCADHKSSAGSSPKLTGFSLRWVHPRLGDSHAIRVDDSVAATKLARAFENYNRPLGGVPYDCPMYDVVVTLHAEDGTSMDLKVYLPRARLFPGMWKHPSGPLVYFEVEKLEQKTLVDVLRPYIPKSPVYPTTITNWPLVEFSKGIPDLRHVDYPISGDFSPSDFTHGQK